MPDYSFVFSLPKRTTMSINKCFHIHKNWKQNTTKVGSEMPQKLEVKCHKYWKRKICFARIQVRFKWNRKIDQRIQRKRKRNAIETPWFEDCHHWNRIWLSKRGWRFCHSYWLSKRLAVPFKFAFNSNTVFVNINAVFNFIQIILLLTTITNDKPAKTIKINSSLCIKNERVFVREYHFYVCDA